MPSEYANAVLIYNPEAGRQRWRKLPELQRVRQELERAGIATTPQVTTGPGSATELARRAVQDGADLIVVCGGDGTINEAVCGMAHSSVPLAVLPGGTTNGLARELRLPLSIRDAARAIPSATPRRVALGRAQDRYFLMMTGVGLDARVLDRLPRRWKELLGIGGYVLATIRQVLGESPIPFTLVMEGQRLTVTFAIISRCQYYGPLRIVREADLFSDRLDVYCFPSRNRLRYVLYALALLAGQLRRLPDVIHLSTQRVQCEELASERRKVLFQVDGELVGSLPCNVAIVADALTLLVPAQDSAPAIGRR